jgi:hypothetical protein
MNQINIDQKIGFAMLLIVTTEPSGYFNLMKCKK